MSTEQIVDAANAQRGGGIKRILLAVIIGLLCIDLLWWAASNPRFEWGVVGHYFFAGPVLRGVRQTILITLIVEAFSCVLSVAIALLRLSFFPPARWFAAAFVWILRSIPPLVQLILWYNIAYLIPKLALGVPFGPKLFEANTNHIVSAYVSGVIGLTLFNAANLSEIVRAGILSVDHGQREAAKALGFRPAVIFVRIVLPQAMRVIIPPSGNLLIMLVQGTSLLSAITVGELLFSVETIYSVNFKTVPLLLVACAWYTVIVSVLSIGQHFLEKRYNQGWSSQTLSSKSPLRSRLRLTRGNGTLDPTAASTTEGKREDAAVS